jgi:hypothetical protein
LTPRNACYHSAKNLVFKFAIKSIKIKKYRTIILPFVLYGGETWLLTLKEEHWLRVPEDRVLRIFRPKRDEVRGQWENYIMRSFNICTPHPIQFR